MFVLGVCVYLVESFQVMPGIMAVPTRTDSGLDHTVRRNRPMRVPPSGNNLSNPNHVDRSRTGGPVEPQIYFPDMSTIYNKPPLHNKPPKDKDRVIQPKDETPMDMSDLMNMDSVRLISF